jgi:SAM-dependent methyltransferase
VSLFRGADAYERFMGRFSRPLAPLLADYAGIERGQRVVDVGCGTGALTAELVARVGADSVVALDPSEPLVTAARERHPDVELHVAPAEQIPCEDDAFDAALAQLVVHFMADPVAGLREMRRVTRPGGTVAACVWDHAGGRGPLSFFWAVLADVDPEARDESQLAGAREGHLAELFRDAGIGDVEETTLAVEVTYASFEEWWEPYTLGVGPPGAYVAQLDDDARERLVARLRERQPPAPFTITGRAWTARGRA